MKRLPDFLSQTNDYHTMREIVKSLGYIWFTGDMNLNFIGIRTPQSEALTNKFDDYFIFAYEIGDKKRCYMYEGTTDPGSIIGKQGNKDGLAIAEPGQYMSAYKLGLHKGRKALVNDPMHPIYYRRFVNRSVMTPIKMNHIGLNHHDSGSRRLNKSVNHWSEGCQVACFKEDIENARTLLARQSMMGHGDSLTYTLIDYKEL